MNVHTWPPINLTLVGLLGLSVVAKGQTKHSAKWDSTSFMEKAASRFRESGTDLRGTPFAEYDLMAGIKIVPMINKNAATDKVYDYARRIGTCSSVAISTSAGPGAIILYQTLGQRRRNEPPTTAKELTDLTEQMYIGRYHIWSKRGDAVTSNPDSEFNILGHSERVKLQEK
jgi:hypothetical protein